MPRLILLAVVLAAIALAAYLLFRTPGDAERLAKLQKEVGPSGIVFRTELNGRPLAFLLLGCKVYLLDLSGRKIRREKVLQPGFYPWFTTCIEQTMKLDGKYLRVWLSQTAIGAGGGNIGGGNYRSEDGRHWEKDTPDGWRPVSEAQP